MKIVVLDGITLNPGDLSWDKLKALGNVTVYDRTPSGKIQERSSGAEILLTNKTLLTGNVLETLPSLRYIGILSTGYNVVDIETAKRKGIIVTNVPSYSTSSVVQHTFALLLELCLRVQRHSDSVEKGDWVSSVDFSYSVHPLVELSGKTLGIIGFGNIGQKMADVAASFGMKVVSFSTTNTDQSHRPDFRWVSIEELFRESDVVTLHCPLVPETKGLVSLRYLKLMKRSSFLLNTSRGAVVVEEDLAHALNNDLIAGAGIDVLSSEPPTGNNPLLKAKNCIITPHIAWATKEARTRLMEIAVSNLSGFLAGRSVNVVNK